MSSTLLAAPLLASRPDAGPGVHLHVLLTSIQTAPLALAAGAVEVLAILWYVVGVRRLAARGRRWPAPATAAFVAGVLLVWVAVGSGLAAYDDVNASAHVIQHLLLMMAAPPLIALGKPVTLASQAAPRRVQVGLLRVVHSRALAVLTFPVVSWFLYYGAMYTDYQDRGVYRYFLTHGLAHDASHAVVFLIGYLYWQPLVGSDPTRWRLPAVGRAASILSGMPFEAFLGITVSEYRTPLNPASTLADTHAAGEIFWAGAMVIAGLCLAAVAAQWFRQLDRETSREDRRAEAQSREAQARAEQLHVEGVRDGWTVPWWRLAELEAQQRREAARGHPPG